jgi:predicted DNA-binding transcriptional regulator YafY
MSRKLKTQYYRWMNIHDDIKKGRYPCAGKIAELLEVSVKTIRRDIEYLRTMLDAPIEYDPYYKGFYYTSDGFELGSIRVSGREYLAMLLSSRVFSSTGTRRTTKAWRGSLPR